jgi:hypothetical protein
VDEYQKTGKIDGIFQKKLEEDADKQAAKRMLRL